VSPAEALYLVAVVLTFTGLAGAAVYAFTLLYAWTMDDTLPAWRFALRAAGTLAITSGVAGGVAFGLAFIVRGAVSR
jgi:hypothetical protein